MVRESDRILDQQRFESARGFSLETKKSIHINAIMMKVERARIILVPDRVYLYPAGYLVYPDYNRRVVQTTSTARTGSLYPYRLVRRIS